MEFVQDRFYDLERKMRWCARQFRKTSVRPEESGAASQVKMMACLRPACNGEMVNRKESNATLIQNGVSTLPSACKHHDNHAFCNKTGDGSFFNPDNPCENCGSDRNDSTYRNNARVERNEKRGFRVEQRKRTVRVPNAPNGPTR